MSDLLFFNGVNGTTGGYGLKPMTTESLSDQILNAQFAESKKLKELQEKLKNDKKNKKMVMQIVEVLTKRAVQEPGEKTASQSEWLDALATELFIWITQSKSTESGQVKALAKKLEQDAVKTIMLIVELLGSNQKKKLSEFLLDKAPDDSETLKEKLKQDTMHKITEIQKGQLGESNVTALDSGAQDVRKNWLRTFTQELRSLQIESLKSLPEVTGVIKGPLDKLIEALQALPDQARGSQGDWIEALVAKLQDLSAQGDKAPWGKVVDSLFTGLEPLIINTDDNVSWKNHLFSVELDLQSDLEECTLSDEFRQKFQDHKISLSEDNVTVELKEESGLWQIRDVGKKYTVEKTDETLIIYTRKNLLEAIHKWLGTLHNAVGHLGAVEWVDPAKLNQAGWGIIFPAKMVAEHREAIKKALAPLLRLRLLQVDFHDFEIQDSYYDVDGSNPTELSELLDIRLDNEFHPKYQEYFRLYEGKDGYRPNDTASKFLTRFGARASDPADPEKVPYYLLLVGTPEEIPFDFQYALDVQYAVGRIDFGDNYAAYENYARNVVAAERGGFEQTAKVTFFGVSSQDDTSTESSSKHLIEPLYEHFGDKALDESWEFEHIPPEQATKAGLLNLMKEAPPAFLLTASHGMEFDMDDPKKRQEKNQGALLCSDWPGPNAWRGDIPADHYLSGQDVRDNGDAINLRGMIAFLFACYGAGTPLYDEYYKQAFKEKGKVITERPFVADLPKAMLSLQEGSALAVVGHVERAWGTSFLGAEAGKSRKSEYVAVFESAIERLLKGHPIGSAMDYFNVRYAALSTELTVAYDNSTFNPDPYELAGLWTANNDARGYVIIGDPAVRLGAAKTEEK
ncbi:MAG: hypothetical protein GY832_23325 [Chloroflexi bacterium]|nr:hypothetical protein [Chloroflexota bacterium]